MEFTTEKFNLPPSTVPANHRWCGGEVYVRIACGHWDRFFYWLPSHKAIRWLGWSSFLLVLPFLCPQRPKLNSRHQRGSAFKHWRRSPPTNTCTYTLALTCLPFEKHTFPTYSMSCSRQQVGLPTVCSCHRKVTFPRLLWWEAKWGNINESATFTWGYYSIAWEQILKT